VTGAVNIDVAVVGGGIAGLWLLDRLTREGYVAALFEAGTLGGGQTVHSQGIIHSGAKYALGGKKTKNQRLLANMPGNWLGAVEGHNPPDLSAVRVASRQQFLAFPKSIVSFVISMIADRFLASAFSSVRRHLWPAEIVATGFRGTLIRLAEPVLDVPSLLSAFAATHGQRIRQLGINNSTWSYDTAAGRHQIKLGGGTINARWMVATAGGGNGLLSDITSADAPAQERPLHMVLLKGDLPEIYLHMDAKSGRPALTISSHTALDGSTVWYIGGDVAEVGIDLTSDAVIADAIKRLARYFPNLSLTGVTGASVLISRHESATPDQRIPDGPAIKAGNVPNSLVAWPTKLAYAPMLADAVIEALDDPAGLATADLPGAPPPIAQPPWETADWQPLP
jgi:hypothetical protein